MMCSSSSAVVNAPQLSIAIATSRKWMTQSHLDASLMPRCSFVNLGCGRALEVRIQFRNPLADAGRVHDLYPEKAPLGNSASRLLPPQYVLAP